MARAARDLRVLDPCCGSSHFLVEAFELLVRLRIEEERLPASDAVCAVLKDNFFGLEIDPRSTQIAAFNLALAAWRTTGGWIELPPLNIACCGIAPNASEAERVRLADELEGLTGRAEDPDLCGGEASLARGLLQEEMAGYTVFSTTLPQRDGRTLYVRKTNAPEGLQRVIYAALGVAMKAGGLRKTTI